MSTKLHFRSFITSTKNSISPVFSSLGFLLLVTILPLFSSCGTSNTEKDDQWILAIGTYTRREAHVNGRAKGINLLSLDPKTGELKRHNAQSGIINPSFITIHPSLPMIYNVNEHAIDEMGGINQIQVFPGSGDDLKLLRSLQAGTAPCHISLDKSGRLLFISNYSSGSLVTYPIDEEGNIVPPYRLHRLGSDDPAATTSSHAHMALATPDNKFVYVTDLGQDSIFLFEIKDDLSGVDRRSSFSASQKGAGPRHLDFHPDLPILYVLNELNGTVDVFERDLATGYLQFAQNVSITEGQAGQPSGAAIHVHPTGNFLYTSNRGDFDEITCFRIDPSNGYLQLETTYPSGGQTPRSFAISPDGELLVIANQDSETIRVYSINQESGVLSQIGSDFRVLSPASVAFFPNWITAE